MSEKVTGAIDKKVGIGQFQDINWSFFSTLALNIKFAIPKVCKCLCCRETSRDRIFKRGFDKFKKEIVITNILKTIRILKANTKKNFT